MPTRNSNPQQEGSFQEGGSQEGNSQEGDSQEGGAGGDTPRLLLVEDDPEVAAGLEKYLTLEGYRVSCVGEGTGALPAIESEDPDLILLDLRLPRKDGFEVLQAMRREGIERPVIVLTVLRPAAHERKCLRLGADAYLRKPFRLACLIEAVEETLKQRRSS
jgi:DNA-binding response OmpR family regulator